jgi:hypothetical protein
MPCPLLYLTVLIILYFKNKQFIRMIESKGYWPGFCKNVYFPETALRHAIVEIKYLL